MYMALTLARFKDGHMRIAAAGMPQPLVFRAATGSVETLRLRGLPLGGVTFPYTETSLKLEPGDAMLLMSDGLAERFDPEDHMFGFDRVAERLSAYGHLDPERIVEELQQDGERWARGRIPEDDITLMVLKFS